MDRQYTRGDWITRRAFLSTAAGAAAGAYGLALGLAAEVPSTSAGKNVQSIDDFLRDFAAEWVSGDPDLATLSRYFDFIRDKQKQDDLEGQVTPRTDAYRRSRIQLAKERLEQLRQFARAKMNDTQRVSADLMAWQLDVVVRQEPFLDSGLLTWAAQPCAIA